ncbi:hypothetical protein Rcae01_05488 [Novipirellula caenicola]|uniref:Uncharacterized protein n=1 Tax=Novipirellula caenicola TaxID=1536901 RepID=A0ABP9VXX3_9BACT
MIESESQADVAVSVDTAAVEPYSKRVDASYFDLGK